MKSRIAAALTGSGLVVFGVAAYDWRAAAIVAGLLSLLFGLLSETKTS